MAREVTARLVEAQLVADGTYPNAAAVFAEDGTASVTDTATTDAPGAGAGSLHYLTEPRNLTDPGKKGQWTAREGARTPISPDADLTLVSDPEKLKRQLQQGEAGGPGPLDDLLLPPGEDPITKPVPGVASHGLLENVPSPLTAVPVLPRTSAVRPSPDTPSTKGTSVPAGTQPRASALAPEPPSPPATAGASPIGGSGKPSGLLYSIEVPPDLTLAASGRTVRAKAEAYEADARIAFGFSPAPKANALGDKVPDRVQGKLALEVKYVDNFQISPRNPYYMVPYLSKIAEGDVAQAKKYDGEFTDGVLWVTNSPELAALYQLTFRAIGLTRSRVVVVPSVRK